jgi:hypothetical protein
MEGKTIAELIAMNQQLVTHTSCQTAQLDYKHTFWQNAVSIKALLITFFFLNNYMMLVFKNLASFFFFCNNGYRWVTKICCFQDIYIYSC